MIYLKIQKMCNTIIIVITLWQGFLVWGSATKTLKKIAEPEALGQRPLSPSLF
jgi:hypothetical protein